jgi:hypothetical protein|nr:MAG TPA: hypothetical protein [Caudoviricetes sp.]
MNLWSTLLAILTGNLIYGIIVYLFIGIIYGCYVIVMYWIGNILEEREIQKN